MRLNLGLRRRPPVPQPIVAADLERAADQCEVNIARFTLAVDQCAKGAARRAELQRHLDYWISVKVTRDLKPGA